MTADGKTTVVHVCAKDAARAIKKHQFGRPVEAEVSRVPGALRWATHLLPLVEREDWLEEQRGYLADLPSRRACWGWVVRQLAAMPRYAYTVRTGREKEAA
ncbi:hypothetical protein J8N05_46690 (plasmid) [Streptomyces sp. BH-SS-21]|uniref:Uncharacterized protein n=1 Tax=Streptomyces liliiviolaceus TaxID=2823109 RepID=A0A940Y9C4_9ACTN|nr:hypothetical protein [Streptomyces liliiviolaceus]MBQ0855651.1 hypothetical protein [Streptomyces liliiviolaceus]